MKILFSVKENSWESQIDARFGRAEWFLVYDEESGEKIFLDNRDTAGQSHGAGPLAAQKVFDIKPDVIITGNGPGGKAATVLSKMNLDIYIGAGDMSVKEAYDAFKSGKLAKE